MPEHRLHARCGCASIGSSEHAATAAGRPFALPTSTRHYERDRPFAVEHLALDVTLDMGARGVRGKAVLDIHRVDPAATELVLDAVGFDVRELTLDGKKASHRYDGRQLTVDVPAGHDKARVAVTYRATPRRGLYFLEPDEHVPGRPRQVWSQCQEEDARHWFPCHDSPHVKMTTEIAAHVPAGWYALSNGALVSSSKPKDGDWVFHWKMDEPHPSYLVTLAAGEFAEIDGLGEDRRSRRAGHLPRATRAAKTTRSAPSPARREMVSYFSEVTGVPYPWNKYAQIVVADFIFGGMENTTATTMYEHILLDERAALDITSDDLIAHELAHQWFGDFVTCRAWYEGWLNEGFATFFEHVWREKHLGRDEYELRAQGGSRTRTWARRTGATGAPIVTARTTTRRSTCSTATSTRRAASSCTGCGWSSATRCSGRASARTSRGHARGVVETRDLQRAMEEVSGRSLGRAFEQWHPQAGAPGDGRRGVVGQGRAHRRDEADAGHHRRRARVLRAARSISDLRHRAAHACA